ncbi:MAG: AbrB/MazE/SpoVT family DNA-binding domain-containing protein [bacterium]
MEASLVKIGNSQGLIIPNRVLKKLGVVTRFNILEKEGNLVCIPVHDDKPRQYWEQDFARALKDGNIPDQDIFDNITNEFDNTEWTW